MNRTRAAGILTALALGAAAAVAAEAEKVLPLQIWLPAPAADATRTAVDDLARCIEAATGEAARIVEAPPVAGTRAICVRTAPEAAAAVLPAAALGPEAFAITRLDERVTIAARAPVATANGVYAFLHKYLGVRWFFPGPLGEHIPQAAAGFMNAVRSEQTAPDYEPRTWSDNANYASWRLWSQRNRLPSPATGRWQQFKDYRLILRILPVAKYGQTHPEYYPLIDGKRRVPAADDSSAQAWSQQPCYGNPDVRRTVVAHIRRYFDENPNAASFGFGLDDAKFFCECERCRALDEGAPVVRIAATGFGDAYRGRRAARGDRHGQGPNRGLPTRAGVQRLHHPLPDSRRRPDRYHIRERWRSDQAARHCCSTRRTAAAAGAALGRTQGR